MPKFQLYKHNDEIFNNITGFFMNFELFLFWPIMQIRKKGGWN